MKILKKILFFSFIILPAIAFSQNDSISKKDTTIYTIIEEPAAFVGGRDALNTFFRENLIYPKRELRKNITGTCYISFTVEKDGSLSNITVMRGVKDGKGCDEEALRLMKLMPKWIPGKQNGKPVTVKFTLR